MESLEIRKILIVEDDEDLQNILRINLKSLGYFTSVAGCGADAVSSALDGDFDIILLDIMLPDFSGDIVCRKIRENSVCPIIFMSCLDDDETIINALGVGGDDYIVKPINMKLLAARIESKIRRYHNYLIKTSEKLPKLITFATLSIDTVYHQVIKNGEVVTLSPIEYSILIYITSHPNQLLLYNDIYKEVWMGDSLGDYRTVMVHVSNLRKKIENYESELIHNVRGGGYIFSAD